jgi:hypothetical protein
MKFQDPVHPPLLGCMQLGYLSHATAEEGRQVEEFSLTLSLGHPLFTAHWASHPPIY